MFEDFYINHMLHHENIYTDALILLADTLAVPPRSSKYVIIYSCELLCPKIVLETNKVHQSGVNFELRDWLFAFIAYVMI